METPLLQKEAAKAVIIDPATGKVLIVRLNKAEQQKRGIDEWHFPGGCRELIDVTLEATAVREAFEEVGLNIRIVRSIGHAAWNALYDGVPAHFEATFYLAELIVDTAKTAITLDVHEVDDSAWVGRDDLDEYPAMTPETRTYAMAVLGETYDTSQN